jgi:hypothetical protein
MAFINRIEACWVMRAQDAARVVLGLPVAALSAVARLRADADEADRQRGHWAAGGATYRGRWRSCQELPLAEGVRNA